MVAKDWKEFVNDNSPSILRKYMDACEAFLIAPTENNDRKYTYTQIPVARLTNDDPQKSLGLIAEKLNLIEESVCYFCHNMVKCKDEHIVSGNPFTRAQFMVMCKECKP